MKYIDDGQRFYREVKNEMSKVTWPTWLELKGSTFLVVIVSTFFALYVGSIDLLLSFIRRLF